VGTFPTTTTMGTGTAPTPLTLGAGTAPTVLVQSQPSSYHSICHLSEK
jgi:hypothetical protein